MLLEADRARIVEIEAQILDLERSLPVLRAEKIKVQERIDSYHYPVLTLPNEIVSEIFIHFLPVYPLCAPPVGDLSPTSLTQICRKWREVALATPQLWRTIGLSSLHPFEQQHHIFDLWLGRSRHCPLSIDVVELPIKEKILATLIPHCARWERLILCIIGDQFPTFTDPMPLLRYLDLELTRRTPLAFPDVPLLRTVILEQFSAHSVVLPWAQLTSLTLNGIRARDGTRILLQTTNLLYCELDAWDYGVAGGQFDTDIPLLYLESFRFNSRSGEDMPGGHLDCFIVPALRNLSVRELFLGSNPIVSLTSFISRAGCRLQELYIIGARTLTEDDLREAFPSIPKFSLESSLMLSRRGG